MDGILVLFLWNSTGVKAGWEPGAGSWLEHASLRETSREQSLVSAAHGGQVLSEARVDGSQEKNKVSHTSHNRNLSAVPSLSKTGRPRVPSCHLRAPKGSRVDGGDLLTSDLREIKRKDGTWCC